MQIDFKMVRILSASCHRSIQILFNPKIGMIMWEIRRKLKFLLIGMIMWEIKVELNFKYWNDYVGNLGGVEI
ncbi:uncharacterized protein OCT59_006679 [Rhizophagus irregularis]|uniref:uncharacterized protein n=1 Tax=Rhizophagus irregularis TaxID=588596 RepID=UPI0019E9F4E5|nr:hypothetical protein OCT59_006679 [Rhizophagus irregularis]GBC19929.2 hypothetical protein RIR_jg27028.t1 [Rhizophagus irregularis DAOM 181602=DAOM 197198]CAB4494138.1 unnamed protein product [Rhizophagus irregularis]